MRQLQLLVQPGAYELRLDGALVTRLDGGASALLAGAGTRLGDLDIEAAIERAEEWLMPFSKAFESLTLEVVDEAGNLRTYLGRQATWTVDEVEQAFNRVHQAIVRGQLMDRQVLADVVLLRELAHHGRLSRIVLLEPPT